METKIKVLSVDDGVGIAATYARSSEKLQSVADTSLDAQEAVIVARAETLGYHVPEVHRLREYGSCGDADRPALAELHRLVASQEVQCVVVCGADRLTRSLLELQNFMRHAAENGVLLLFGEVPVGPEHLLRPADA